jgi:signal transduction histidine kinase
MAISAAHKSHGQWEQQIRSLHREFSVLEQELVLLKSIDQAILEIGAEGSVPLEEIFLRTVERFGKIHQKSQPLLCYVYLDPDLVLLPDRSSSSAPTRLDMSDALRSLMTDDVGSKSEPILISAEQGDGEARGDGLFGQFPEAETILLHPMYYKARDRTRLLCVFLLADDAVSEGSSLGSPDFISSIDAVVNQLSIAYLHSERSLQQRRLQELWAAFLGFQLSPLECFQALAARIPGFLPDFGPIRLSAPPHVQILTPQYDRRTGSIRHLVIQGTTGSEAAGSEIVKLDESVCGLLVDPDLPFFYDDPTKPEYGRRYKGYLGAGLPIRTEFAIPLRQQDQLVGILNLESEIPNAFGVHHRDAVFALSDALTPLVSALAQSSTDVQFSADSTTGAYLDALASVFRHAINTPLATLRLNADNALQGIEAETTKMSPRPHSVATAGRGEDMVAAGMPRPNLEFAKDQLETLLSTHQQIYNWTQDFAADIGGYGSTGKVILPSLVHSVVDLVNNGLLAKTHGISISDATSKYPNAAAVCSSLFKQHLYSVIHNSVLVIEDRMEHDPSPGLISIWLTEVVPPKKQEVELNRSWVLHISDNGPGLTPENLEKLRRFTPGTRFRRGDGQGSGLVALQRYVSFYGGRVELEAEQGKSFEVLVYLKQHLLDRPQEPSTDAPERG